MSNYVSVNAVNPVVSAGIPVQIYQMKSGDAWHTMRWTPYRELPRPVAPSDYDLVYTFETGADVTLEGLFDKFNTDIPEDFRGHSMSVSDLISWTDEAGSHACYVDQTGFTPVGDFVPAMSVTSGELTEIMADAGYDITAEDLKGAPGENIFIAAVPAQGEPAVYPLSAFLDNASEAWRDFDRRFYGPGDDKAVIADIHYTEYGKAYGTFFQTDLESLYEALAGTEFIPYDEATDRIYGYAGAFQPVPPDVFSKGLCARS